VQNWTSGGLGGSYNTDDDPEFADPDGQDDTVGSEDEDLRLTSGSSAIDAGCNAEVPDADFDLDRDGDTSEPLPLDLGRGTRFLDDSGTTDCPYGGSCGTAPIVDMGSYEYLNTNGLGDPEPPEAGSPAPEPSGTAYIASAYDALGRRIEKIVDSGGAQVEVTRYYYAEGPGSAGNGQNVVLETDADEAPRRSFVHGSQYIDERGVMRLPNGQEYYYLPRELYSVAALTDDTGTIVEAATYDTYGQMAVYNGAAQAVEQSSTGNPCYFTGRRLDLLPTASSPQPVTKQLYHYRARAYDPGNGRFLQRDPVYYNDSMNLLEYVVSNPPRFSDPLGLGRLPGMNKGRGDNPLYTAPPEKLQELYKKLCKTKGKAFDELKKIMKERKIRPSSATKCCGGAILTVLTITSEANAAEIQWYPTRAYAAHRANCDAQREKCRDNCNDLYGSWWNPWAGGYLSDCRNKCWNKWTKCDGSFQGKRYTLCDPDLPGCEESEF